MHIILFIYCFFMNIVLGQCIQEKSYVNLIIRNYEIGDTISIEHQLKEFDVCYGNYKDGIFKMTDFNHNVNGGYYKVSMMRINATW